ncbi:MAG: non-canonical purine NTP pyrophosphatase [Planctomycetes bacterium]|nr:non-canonical purine NTP pyrophosphatase [Planctomycetota bacterium]
MLTILIATRNQHKVREIKAIYRISHRESRLSCKGIPNIRFISLSRFPDAPEVKENGRTYLSNAAKKAVAVAKHTGHLTLGEDSGIEVKALNWMPGLRSARYATSDRHKNAGDIDNNAKLLLRLAEVSPLAPRRRASSNILLSGSIARYRSAVVIAHPQKGVIARAEGICWGRIALKPAGKNGFGYDPLFIPNRTSRIPYPATATFGQLPISLKHRISHRAMAIRKILAKF